MTRQFVLAVGVVALVLSAAAVQADPILVNGSFELGPSFFDHDIDIAAGSTEIVGWTPFATSSNGGAIDYLGPAWDVSDGIHAVDLDGRDAVFGGIQQTFTTISGQAYLVSFDLSGNPQGGPQIKSMRASVDGFSQNYMFDSAGQTIEALIWQTITFSFIASSATATLSFISLSSTPNSYGALIDNVRVDAVPEPATASLLALGMAASAITTRRKAASKKRV